MTRLSTCIQLERAGFSLQADLTFPAAGVSVLFGHSGSGKTTLLRCIAGLEQARGEIRFGAEIWQDKQNLVPTWKRGLACVFQESSLFEHLTAQGNLDFAIKRTRAPLQPGETNDIIELLGIGHVLKRYPSQLSGGERQRVAIARALLSKPRLLLMDEPLASLDEQRKLEILPYLEEMKRSLQLPVIYVTHSMTEVTRLADHMVCMRDGQVTSSGNLQETLANIHDARTLDADAAVVIEGHIIEQDQEWQLTRVAFSGGEIRIGAHELPVGSAVRIQVLAKDVSLALSEHRDTSIVNLLPCTIDAIVPAGRNGIVLVRIMAGETALLSRMTHLSATLLGLSVGQKIWAQIKSAAIL
jgi:molybdate transport system ATP-binding protein